MLGRGHAGESLAQDPTAPEDGRDLVIAPRRRSTRTTTPPTRRRGAATPTSSRSATSGEGGDHQHHAQGRAPGFLVLLAQPRGRDVLAPKQKQSEGSARPSPSGPRAGAAATTALPPGRRHHAIPGRRWPAPLPENRPDWTAAAPTRPDLRPRMERRRRRRATRALPCDAYGGGCGGNRDGGRRRRPVGGSPVRRGGAARGRGRGRGSTREVLPSLLQLRLAKEFFSPPCRITRKPKCGLQLPILYTTKQHS